MKIFKKVFLLLFLTKLYSQSNIVPKIETPNAASIEKYGEVPVSLFTGVPYILIPIYTMEIGNIKVPVSISYHPASVRPGTAPGWAGLGWNLNAYGTITRKQNGKYFDELGSMGLGAVIPYYPNPDASTSGAEIVESTVDWGSTENLID